MPGFPFDLIAPAFDWLQVEVTSFCNAACVYCPHTVYRDNWLSRHLPVDTFQKLRRALRKTQLVHLQGWGEPLLHPDFFTLVALARQAGCRVGTTTNGTLVDAPLAARLVAGGLDFVSFPWPGRQRKKTMPGGGEQAWRKRWKRSGFYRKRRKRRERRGRRSTSPICCCVPESMNCLSCRTCWPVTA